MHIFIMYWDHLEDEYHYLQHTIWMFDKGLYRKENSFPGVKLENTVWGPSTKCLCVLLREDLPKLNKRERNTQVCPRQFSDNQKVNNSS